MRRLIAFMAVLGILLIPPLIASASDVFYENATTITATIPTAAAPDANIGAMGPSLGMAMLTDFYDNGSSMTNGTTYDVPVTYNCLVQKGSAETGIQPISASALVNSYMTFCLDASGHYYDATASTNTAATAGASSTCTWHPLRC